MRTSNMTHITINMLRGQLKGTRKVYEVNDHTVIALNKASFILKAVCNLCIRFPC